MHSYIHWISSQDEEIAQALSRFTALEKLTVCTAQYDNANDRITKIVESVARRVERLRVVRVKQIKEFQDSHITFEVQWNGTIDQRVHIF